MLLLYKLTKDYNVIDKCLLSYYNFYGFSWNKLPIKLKYSQGNNSIVSCDIPKLPKDIYIENSNELVECIQKSKILLNYFINRFDCEKIESMENMCMLSDDILLLLGDENIRLENEINKYISNDSDRILLIIINKNK